MSNYTKATNFATKDTLPTGDPGKIVKGTEIDSEFNAIASAISSKADTASPTFTGTPAAPTAAAGSNTTQLATTAFVTAALQAVYPVGSIYINSASSTNPSSLLGFGTWEAFGAGRVLVGLNASDSLFDTLEETGGSKDSIVVSHTHTASVSDSGHTHGLNYFTDSATGGASSNISAIGVSERTDTTLIKDGTASGRGITTSTTGISVSNSTTGSSGTNANLQPYITVRMWKRTA
jgi:hypothetical protein